MMNKHSQGELPFEPAQSLGPPSVFPPEVEGKLSVAVQFIIPELSLGSNDREPYDNLSRKCGIDVWAVDTRIVLNRVTKEKATLVTIAFYLSPLPTGGEHPREIQISFKSRLLIERFLGLLAFFIGIRCSALHPQTTIRKNGEYVQIRPVIRRSDTPWMVILSLPPKLDSINFSDIAFSALFWLRRGLAERDPIETFSAFMVCLQIIARHVVVLEPSKRYCPSCRTELWAEEPSITSLVQELIVSRLGASQELFDKLWKARNAVIAHGNLPVTPEIFLDLTELKFEAAKLAFQGIKLIIGIPFDSPQSPGQHFFKTDAFMYVD